MRKLLEETMAARVQPVVEDAEAERSEDAGQDLLKQIDWVALEKLISEHIGTSVTITPTFARKTRGDRAWVITWESQDILDAAGIMKFGLKYLKIAARNGNSPSAIREFGYYVCTGVWDMKALYNYSDAISVFEAKYYLEAKRWEYQPTVRE